jgi:hypothetical protein
MAPYQELTTLRAGYFQPKFSAQQKAKSDAALSAYPR